MREFFDAIRGPIGGGTLTQSQVNGIEAVIAVCRAERLSDPETAYVLATAWHETGGRMQPIHEWGSEAYFKRMYDPEGERPSVARQLGNTEPGDGVRYAGRGYVQLTGRRNYAMQGAKLSLPLVEKPDLAMHPETAALILVRGMRDGDFTGHSLADHIAPDHFDFVGARRIVNGTDQAGKIAVYAERFLSGLRSMPTSAHESPAQPQEPAPGGGQPESGGGLLEALLKALAWLLARFTR